LAASRERASMRVFAGFHWPILWFGLSEKAIFLSSLWARCFHSINVEAGLRTFRESTPWPAAISVRAARGSSVRPPGRQPPSSGLGLNGLGLCLALAPAQGEMIFVSLGGSDF